MKKSFILPLVLLFFSAAVGLLSTGFLEFDEITHYLKAQELFHDWHVALDIWGRPACTILFGLAAAAGGMNAARIMAMLITGLTGFGTMRLLDALPTRPGEQSTGYFTRTAPGWAWLLLYAQPLFLLNSFTVMTEMLLACAWVWAAVMLWRRRLLVAGLLIGLGAFGRAEGWFAIAAWPLFLLLWRRQDPGNAIPGRIIVASLLLSVMPTLLWWLLGTVAFQNAHWMIDYFPWQVRSQYGKTGILFLASSLISLALWMWLPVAAGVASLVRNKDRRAALLLIIPAAAFFALHATLGTLGLMGAMSLPRYFVSVSPFLALLGVRGLQSIESRTRWPRMLRRAVIACTILPLLLLILSNQLPMQKSTNERQMDVAISGFTERALPRDQWPTHLLAAHPYVYYVLDIPMRHINAGTLQHAPVGTYLITDALLWNREGLPSPEALMSWGYRFDPFIDQRIGHVPVSFDLNGIALSSTRGMGVGLWVKDR